MAINFPDPATQSPVNIFSPSSSPMSTSNGITYKWTDGSWTISSGEDTSVLPDFDGPNHQPGTTDDRYVEITGDKMTGDLKIGPDIGTDNITLSTSGLGQFGNGVSVSGGTAAEIVSGMRKAGQQLYITNASQDYINITTAVINLDQKTNLGTNAPDVSSGDCVHIRYKLDSQDAGNNVNSLRVRPNNIAAGKYNIIKGVSVETGGTSVTQIEEYHGVNVQQPSGISNWSNAAGNATTVYGIKSGINGSAPDRYNIYADGTAPSYFAGNVVGSNGFQVTGGGAGTVINGLGFAAADGENSNRVRLYANGTAAMQVSDTYVTSFLPITAKPNSTGTALTFGTPPTDAPLQDAGAFVNFAADLTGSTYAGSFSFSKYSVPASTAADSIACTDMAAMRVRTSFGQLGTLDGHATGDITSGVKLEMNTRTDKNIFNVLADGSAPNFFKGHTYIGGTASRNTFDLWKSTLTEEQLEQLEAGTFAVPANVSVPGDGSFARQWYYNQQDAETQALLDSGELEYPTHLAAATFTDTFALGDNTNINLTKDGLIQAGGIEFIKNWQSGKVSARGIVYSGGRAALLSTNHPNADDENVDVFLARVDPTEYDADGNRSPINVDTAVSFRAESPLGNNAGEYGQFKSYIGFRATDQGDGTTNAVWDGTKDSYGFLSGVTDRTHAAGGQTYGFYAEGDAPNYFRGNIDCDGLINGAFSLRMQTDDPAAFQTTYTTDEEGNQVANETYIGTTEDLLSIIKDLRARIDELESITLQPLYSTFADLPNASDHHGKTAHVHDEGALYFAHAGSWVKLQNA